MKTPINAIVQVEFFSPSVSRAKSIEEAVTLAIERGMDGDRIKTVVRIRDNRGSLTGKIRSLGASRSFTRPAPKPSIGRMLSILFLGKDPLPNQTLSLAKKRIRDAIAAKTDIGVENSDFRFRPIQPHEVHELIERITRSEAAWYFVFKPNHDLYTETPGTSIAWCI